jgi:hypothetical protein
MTAVSSDGSAVGTGIGNGSADSTIFTGHVNLVAAIRGVSRAINASRISLSSASVNVKAIASPAFGVTPALVGVNDCTFLYENVTSTVSERVNMHCETF